MKRKASSQRILRSLLVGVLLFYVGFHMLGGDNGVIGRLIEERKQQQLYKDIAQVRTERTRLEHHIALLSSPAIDRDLLDELARRQLPVSGKDEVIIVGR